MARTLSISRLFLLALALLAVAPAQPSAPVADPASPALTQGEVRLRKLHLVRPDLIPYPIVYEVVC